MRAPKAGRPPRITGANVNANETSDLGGIDFAFATLALAFMTAGFWRLWPEASLLSDPPTSVTIVQAGLLALGFIGIAMQWETWLRAFARNPTGLVFLGLALVSAFWAAAPSDSLRLAILLVLAWCFGMALSLRFGARALAEIAAMAGVLGIFAQFGAHQGLPRLDGLDGDLAFAIVATAWAVWCAPSRRIIWALACGALAILAIILHDTTSLGAIIGFASGGLVGFAMRFTGRDGTRSVYATAWLLVFLLVAATLFFLFGADSVSGALSRFYSDLGSQNVLGDGFGSQGTSVASALGAGMGVVGLGAGLLLVFGFLLQLFLGNPNLSSGMNAQISVWSASLCAILVSPSAVSIFAPLCILFVAATFSMSLACLPETDQGLR
ncbi:MAG: hypothetical protein RLZZ157_736 [Pseudomonadota bacterium]|jgi:hypothetical protein